jgi:type I restriction enzyme R subunit
VEAFDAEVEKLGTPTAKADTILNRMKRTITERIDEDPAYFRRFSEMVEETILAYKQGRIDQLEYLRQAESHLDTMRSGRSDGLPSQLTRYQHAAAYYGVMRESLVPYGVDENSIADLAIRQESIIEAHKVTDWENNHDVKQQIRRDLDELFYEVEEATGIEIELDETDLIIDRVLEVAKARSRKS